MTEYYKLDGRTFRVETGADGQRAGWVLDLTTGRFVRDDTPFAEVAAGTAAPLDERRFVEQTELIRMQAVRGDGAISALYDTVQAIIDSANAAGRRFSPEEFALISGIHRRTFEMWEAPEPAQDGPLTLRVRGDQVLGPGDAADPSEIESVFDLDVWSVAEGRAPERIAGFDPVAGYLAPPGVTTVQLRVAPPLPGGWPQFPPMLAGDILRTETVFGAAGAAITAAAPQGWQKITLTCTATARAMEIAATVTLPDGQARAWAPPAIVSQWLHRWRMREYRPTLGAWFTMRLELVAGANPLGHPDFEGRPDFRVLPGVREHLADELRLLPRNPDVIPEWLLREAIQRHKEYRIHRVTSSEPERDLGGITEMAQLFEGIDGDLPVWYRPMVGRRESVAIERYLQDAPLVLSSRGLSADLITGDEAKVPMGYHTDGRWVWSSATAYYLREHDIPPMLELVDHIRENRYTVPEVPQLAMRRAAALAMGRPTSESEVDKAFDEAMAPVFEAVRIFGTSPTRYSLGEHRDDAWCLVREGDWYTVYRDGQRERNRFGDVRAAAAYLAGQLIANRDELRYQEDEEIHWWQSPFQSVSEVDPSLEAFGQVMATTVADIVVDRYGTPDGNVVFVADTPFAQRDLPADHAEREFHRYRLRGGWTVVTGVTQSGGRAYLLPGPISTFLDDEWLEELPAVAHPGLPPITDAMRAEARRSPGGWLWCADPDINPRFIEGAPNHTLLGAYKVDDAGELTGETFVNDAYLPSPAKRGFPAPRTDFEAVLNFVSAGWLPHERILGAALAARFIIESDGAGGLRIGVDQQGRRFMVAYSSPGYVPATAAAPMQVDGRALLPVLAGVTLVVNPGGTVGIELPGDDLIAAAG
ncbi:MAG TPA: glycohydrolase toxin TNT-related protein [Actinokineospora sp.]|nr:glycohydrolase toxin TNT-related protein [Actinokineospora sp.]